MGLHTHKVEEAPNRPEGATGSTPVLLKNPLEALMFSPLPFVRRTPEQVSDLIKIVYNFWSKKLYPDALNRHPLNPKNGGDAEKWNAYLAKLPELSEIQAAYNALKDPEKCAAAIRDFRPMTPAQRLTNARVISSLKKEEASASPRGLIAYLADRCDSRIRSVMNCGPGSFVVFDLREALTQHSENAIDGASIMAGSLRSQHEKVITVDADRRISANLTKQIAFVFEIPIGSDGLAPFLTIARNTGLKIPELRLGSAVDGLNTSNPAQETKARFSAYRLDTILQQELSPLIPYLRARVNPSTVNQLNLLVSRRMENETTLFAIEGAILSYEGLKIETKVAKTPEKVVTKKLRGRKNET